MTKKDAYVAQQEKLLNELSEKIDNLKEKANKAKDDVKEGYISQIEEVKQKQEAAKTALQELKDTDVYTYNSLKKSVTKVFKELQQAVKNASSKIK